MGQLAKSCTRCYTDSYWWIAAQKESKKIEASWLFDFYLLRSRLYSQSFQAPLQRASCLPLRLMKLQSLLP
jgi:hypothetical protein